MLLLETLEICTSINVHCIFRGHLQICNFPYYLFHLLSVVIKIGLILVLKYIDADD